MDPTNPTKLADLFLRERKGEKTDSTIYNNRGHLKEFAQWCDDQGIETVADLTGPDLLEYKLHLRDRVADSTIRNHFSTLRTFFRFCKRMDATRPDQHLHEKLKTPDFSKGDLSRDDMMDFEEVERLLKYLETFQYANERHVLFVIFWHTGCRNGALRGLDLDDYKQAKEREHGYYGLIRFRHRPETDTPLKNGEDGEREVIVWPQYAEIIEDYIGLKRRDRTDEHGRKPLVTSQRGRYSTGGIQRIIYALTRPCYYTNECPHGRSIDTCEAGSYEHASRCPSSVSPHPMRRTAITYHLDQKDWTYEAASGRFNVSGDVLKEHYDESTDEGRRKTRAAHFYDGETSVL